MKKVYAEYFQKSKVFLYPLLNIKKGIRYVPAETYIAWEDLYSIDDYKFICVYKVKDSESYNLFESAYLTSHKLFEEYYKLEDDIHIYTFDYSKFKHDLDMFKLGKYSKFSKLTKEKILSFFGSIGVISEYIKSYMHPEEYHDLYALHLDVSVDTIEKVYELCSIPDLEREKLQIKLPEVNLFTNNSLSLVDNNQKI